MGRVKLSPEKKVNVYLSTRVRKRTASPPKMPNYADRMILMRKAVTPVKTPKSVSKKPSEKIPSSKKSAVKAFDEVMTATKIGSRSRATSKSKSRSPSKKKAKESPGKSTSKISNPASKKSRTSKPRVEFNSKPSSKSNRLDKSEDQLNMIVNLYK